jgi:IMP dehydrogenase
MIVDPVTIGPDQMIGDALEVMRRYKISGVPVTQRQKAGRHPHQPRPAL